MAKKSSGSNEFSRQSDSDLNVQECQGWLYMKRPYHLRTTYVKTWCSFKNKILSVFENKNGKHFEDINIEICRITPLKKTNSSYFEIRHEWQTFHFGTKDEKEYRKWINALQNESLRDEPVNNVIHRNPLFKSYSREESISQLEESNNVGTSVSNLPKSFENEDVYSELKYAKVEEVYHNSTRGSICSDDVFDNGNRGHESNYESKQNSESLVMDKLILMADLERQIRASFVLSISLTFVWPFSGPIC